MDWKKTVLAVVFLLMVAASGKVFAGTISERTAANGYSGDRIKSSHGVFSRKEPNSFGLLFRGEIIPEMKSGMKLPSEGFPSDATTPAMEWILRQSDLTAASRIQLEEISSLYRPANFQSEVGTSSTKKHDRSTLRAPKPEPPVESNPSTPFGWHHHHRGSCPSDTVPITDLSDCRPHEVAEPSSIILLAGCLAALWIARLHRS